jgi:hypothetical protein
MNPFNRLAFSRLTPPSVFLPFFATKEDGREEGGPSTYKIHD